MLIQEMLQKYNKISELAVISDLFANDADRFETYSAGIAGLMLDYSKTAITSEAFADLLSAAEQAGLEAAVEALFSGGIVNESEQRAAWHTLARGGGGEETHPVEDEISIARSRVLAVGESLRRGEVPGGSNGITDIIHLGIGGSELGPRLVADALRGDYSDGPRLHFLASADGHAVTGLIRNLEPSKTALIIATKSFSTRETLLNAATLREWLTEGGVSQPADQMLAITANVRAARAFGIAEDLILKIWPEIGGRFSVWSAMGLPAICAIGGPAFEQLLAGAAAMDQHFRTAPLRLNLPVLLALCGIWHRNVCEYSNLALIPYDERLKLLPAWLQQLDMESNGKSTDQYGGQLTYATSPAVIGGVGTVVQHSFFQSLHQGSDVIPVEFIGVLRPEHGLDAHHRLQLGNMLAQGEALMLGRTSDQTRTFLQTAGIRSEQLEKQLPQRILPGNRPSITLLLDELSAYNLGQLMALYEHKIFAQSVIWNTNAFDQWGVEYGKSLASSYETALGRAPAETGEAQDLLSFVRQKIAKTPD